MVRGQLERELRTLERDLLRMQQELQLSEDTCLVKDEMKKLKKMVRFFVIIVLKYSVYYYQVQNINYRKGLGLNHLCYFSGLIVFCTIHQCQALDFITFTDQSFFFPRFTFTFYCSFSKRVSNISYSKTINFLSQHFF